MNRSTALACLGFGLMMSPLLGHFADSAVPAQPKIGAPTIILQGAADGVQPSDAFERLDANFSGPHQRRILPKIGHNSPQEAPQAYVDAILELIRGVASG